MTPEREQHSISSERLKSILERCPCLEDFLSLKPNFSQEEFDEWLVVTISSFNEIHNTFEEELGKEWQDQTISPLVSVGNSLKIFNNSKPKTNSPEGFHIFVTEAIFLLGFEIGNTEESRYFLKDILNVFNRADMLNQESKNNDVIGKFFYGVMKAGVSFRSNPDLDERFPIDSATNSGGLDVFRDFINSLDF